MSNDGYEQMASSRNDRSSGHNSLAKYGIMAVIVLMLCGASFALGMNFQKDKLSDAPTASMPDDDQFPSQGSGPSGFSGGQGGPRGGQRPNIGEVIEVSDDSITVSSQQSRADQTFKITSDTTFEDNGSTASFSDIKTGDTVLIITDSSDATTASQIMLNPSFSPPNGGSGQSPPSTSEM